MTGLELAAKADGKDEKDEDEEKQEKAEHGELTLVEAIVTPGSMLAGTTATGLDLRERHGVNILAVARQGKRLRERLGRIRFAAGDILLVHGREETLQSALNELGCLPLASRGLRITKPRKVLLANGIFGIALALIVCGLVSPATALVGGAVAMVLAGLIVPGEISRASICPSSCCWPPCCPSAKRWRARTGGSQLIAGGLLELGRSLPPAATLAILMSAVMLLSNVVNHAAAAILAAPVAISLAQSMGFSADPFLMAVAIGASCSFLTPIGHQCNSMVMSPGGYKFGDYRRMGLPLSVLVVASAVPLILWIWPL